MAELRKVVLKEDNNKNKKESSVTKEFVSGRGFVVNFVKGVCVYVSVWLCWCLCPSAER